MARPATLSEAVNRMSCGERDESVWAGLLDEFYLSDDESRRRILEEEPALSGDAKLDCLAAATAEYLWKQHRLGSPLPTWIGQPHRILKQPWHTTDMTAPGIREYLTWASPAEFVNHNIFTDEAPLARARQR
jgi:hypothetical protein